MTQGISLHVGSESEGAACALDPVALGSSGDTHAAGPCSTHRAACPWSLTARAAEPELPPLEHASAREGDRGRLFLAEAHWSHWALWAHTERH